MIIYKSTNLINGKVYIGQTIKTLSYRKKEHICDATKGSKIYFHNALRKYDEDNFKWEVIKICNSINELNVSEQSYIKLYNSMNRERGYNCTSGGKNFKASKETIEKLRQSHLGNSHTEETKRKMSKAATGRKFSKETKKKMSKSFCGEKNPNWGKSMSEEQKKKISDANKGRKLSKETCKKISVSSLGKIISKDTRKKMSDSAIKKWVKIKSDPLYKSIKVSNETKKRMSISAKKRWAKYV